MKWTSAVLNCLNYQHLIIWRNYCHYGQVNSIKVRSASLCDLFIVGREIFVGISSRTNMLGAQAVARAFPEYSTTIVKVYPPAIHLRDYINVVQPEVLVVSKSPAAQKTFKVRFRNFSMINAACMYLIYLLTILSFNLYKWFCFNLPLL